MSSWHLSSLHMSVLRNGLVRHYGEQKATKLAKAFAKMNAYATGGRYGERLQAVKIDTDCKYIPSNRALRDLLGCLNYQCSEGDTEEKFAKTWRDMEHATGLAAESMLHEDDMKDVYEVLHRKPHVWGVHSEDDLTKDRGFTLKNATEATATA